MGTRIIRAIAVLLTSILVFHLVFAEAGTAGSTGSVRNPLEKSAVELTGAVLLGAGELGQPFREIIAVSLPKGREYDAAVYRLLSKIESAEPAPFFLLKRSLERGDVREVRAALDGIVAALGRLPEPKRPCPSSAPCDEEFADDCVWTSPPPPSPPTRTARANPLVSAASAPCPHTTTTTASTVPPCEMYNDCPQPDSAQTDFAVYRDVIIALEIVAVLVLVRVVPIRLPGDDGGGLTLDRLAAAAIMQFSPLSRGAR